MGNVILIGFMGCGKSSVGVKLSYRLRKAVIDTDKEIEKEEQRSISDIFAAEGEAYFRDKETECLRRLIETADNKIISVGGGLPMRDVNRELMHKLGQVVYLRAKPETVYERLKHDTTRPLLRGDNPQEKIKTLMAQREQNYEKAADVIVDVDGKEFEKIVNEIERQIQR
ncbi:MAG: shikimate kinase [Lachnospiraceae bacterium]|nr:shikimate kinase [Lachnospiraceae bacterium]